MSRKKKLGGKKKQVKIQIKGKSSNLKDKRGEVKPKKVKFNLISGLNAKVNLDVLGQDAVMLFPADKSRRFKHAKKS